ncbi:MAG: hypothetical protein Q3971_07795 [Moraxella sp.]|nr:hypothetical protein [Moraxella sp.]
MTFFKFGTLFATLSAGIFFVSNVHSATISTACVYDNYRGRWMCDSKTYYSQAEMNAIQAQITQYKKENPQGCNAPKDGLQLCWSYTKLNNSLLFYHELYDPKRTAQSKHGFSYGYNNGKLLYVSIYDRDIILKGENHYVFNDDDTVTVFDYKSNNSTKTRKVYHISTDEALRRLKLPRSVLTAHVAPTPQAISQIRLPSGCSGTVKMKIGRPACHIGLLQ